MLTAAPFVIDARPFTAIAVLLLLLWAHSTHVPLSAAAVFDRNASSAHTLHGTSFDTRVHTFLLPVVLRSQQLGLVHITQHLGA
jgi:hypothetical protein